MRKVLLVTYLFPPWGGVGVHRALSLAKYLPEAGHRVHVLTTKNPGAVGADPGLLADVPEDVAVTRTWTIDLPFGVKKALKSVLRQDRRGKPAFAEQAGVGIRSGALGWLNDRLTPDPQLFWVPTATRAALQIVRDAGIDTVVVSAPPFSAFLIGNEIKRRQPHIRYIADFRDEWLSYYMNTFSVNRSTFAQARAAEIERATVEAADRVVAVTEASRKEILNRYPGQPESKFRLITNGFDPGTFRAFTPRRSGTDKTVITYVGSVYKPTEPESFVQAVKALPSDIRSSILVRFIGNIQGGSYKSMLESVADVVQLNGFIPQVDAVKQMQETDYLLLICHDLLTVPAKLYDYLGAGKPILALAKPQSEVYRIMNETRSGWCADVRDVSAVRELLLAAHSHKNKLPSEYSPNREAIRNYERPRLAQRYAEIIEECGSNRSQ